MLAHAISMRILLSVLFKLARMQLLILAYALLLAETPWLAYLLTWIESADFCRRHHNSPSMSFRTVLRSDFGLASDLIAAYVESSPAIFLDWLFNGESARITEEMDLNDIRIA